MMPPNYIDKQGNDNYLALTGLRSTPDEIKYKNPVVYARVKYEQWVAEQKRMVKK
jgi:hypothetical protein